MLPVMPHWSEVQWAWLLWFFSLTAWLILELIEFCEEDDDDGD